MTILFTFGGTSGVDTGDIGHSLRCRSAANTSLNRTFGTPTANTSWILHCGIKLGTLTTLRHLLGVGAGSMAGHISLSAGNALTFTDNAGNVVATSTPLERDPTGHGFLTIRSNGTNIKGYWNATEILSYTGTITTLNSAVAHWIGRRSTTNADHFDGYLSRICFVDNGGSLAPQDFIYLNTEINEWVTKSQSAVKAVVDAGGTNSFMLDFDDATSLTTLGYDKSSKGNNWTLNSFSLTAGTTYDHMLDVPGNSYATLNPLYPSGASARTFSEANLRVAGGAAGQNSTEIATVQMVSGKWYYEATVAVIGTASITGVGTFAILYQGNGTFYPSGSGASFTTNDVIGVAVDIDAGTVQFFKNGASQGTVTGTAGAATTPAFALGGAASAPQWWANFGQRPFSYTPPTGFKALCQANLPDVAIKNPKLYFDIKTRTGTAATYSVTGLGFQPDLVWSKSRGRALDHALYDSVRGVQKQLESNTTSLETTEATGLTAFNSDGYTGGALDQINGTTATNSFVDWLWKAGGAAVSNTAGSITSQVSANVDAGFSVVTWNGNGGTATIGHGLGKSPTLILVKSREDAVDDWYGYHTSLGATKGIFLNLTNAAITSSNYWNDTAPTSSVFTVKGPGVTNRSGDDYVAYCFADIEGYSKAFSYTGNASTDGVYVDLGFKPRWILLKCSSTTGNWVVFDTTRNTYNVMGEQLYLNLSNAGSTVTTLDATSRGFKARIATDPNSAQTFIGFAIADVAGKYSLGR